MDTRRSWILVGLILICLVDPTRAQLLENFSDDNLTHDPAWSGDTDHWVINQDKELQLFRSEGGISSLWTEYNFPEEGEFQFYFRLDFSPSSSNAVRIFLWSSAPSEHADTALWVQLGEAGQEDRLHFYWRSDGKDSLIASLEPIQSDEPVNCMVRITHQQHQTRVVYSTRGKDAFEGFTPIEWPDLSSDKRYFGLIAKYTSTRGSSFFFDDLMVDKGYDTNDPTTLESLTVFDGDKVELKFGYPVLIDAADPIFIVEKDGIETGISHVEWAMESSCTVTLSLQDEISSGDEVKLKISSLRDVFGGTMADWDTTFVYLPVEPPAYGDLRINEIYCKPIVSGSLPNAEYLEIINVSRKKIDLAGVRVSDASATSDPMSKRVLLPQEIALLCDEDDIDLFPDSLYIMAIGGFPSLNNSGDELYLYDPDGDQIDHVFYTEEMYLDPMKNQGGWSLENSNPLSECSRGENWTASVDPSGGTPARENSVLNREPPDAKVRMNSISLPDDQTLLIEFNTTIHAESTLGVTDWRVEPDLEIIESIYHAQDGKLELWTNAPIERGLIYRIYAHPELRTCLGQQTDTLDYLEFGIPEGPEQGDIVINEVMYDPYKNGSEFIELHNATDRIFHTDSVEIYLIKEDQQRSEILLELPSFINPGSFPLVAEQLAGVSGFYDLPEDTFFIEADIPSLPNSGGMLELRNRRGVLLDAMHFKDDMHADYLDDTKGVSLERLSPFMSGGSSTNWHSAASLYGGATPMRENSQRMTLSVKDTSSFILQSPTFSPDQDGFEDQMILRYRLDREGYRARVRVFDYAGYPIRVLVNHESLGKEGILTWDGTDNMGHICKIGMYFVQIELNLMRESVQREMLTIILAQTLGNK